MPPTPLLCRRLQALRVISIRSFASITTHAGSSTSPSNPTTLCPVSCTPTRNRCSRCCWLRCCARRGNWDRWSRSWCCSSNRRRNWSRRTCSFRNSNIGTSSTEIALGGNDLVVVCSKVQPNFGPGGEMVGCCDGARWAMCRADRPVLCESWGTEDRRLVCASQGEDIVVRAIRGDGAELCSAGGRVVGSEIFDDVVFNEWVFGPAVDGKVGVAVGAVGSGERNCTEIC